MRRHLASALLALSLLACGERAATSHGAPASRCPAPTIEVPGTPGFPTAAAIETHARVLVQNDVDPRACLVSVVARRESTLLEVTYDGATYRARLGASLGNLQDGLLEHVAAQRRARRLLESGLTTAISSGRGVALGFGDHGDVCLRSMIAAPACVRTPAVGTFLSLTEPASHRLVVDSLSDASASEWELAFGEPTTLTARSGTLDPPRALGAPPPDPDRLADVRSATPEESEVAPDPEAVAIASELPTQAVTVHFETHAVAGARVAVLQRCDGLVPRCVTVVGMERDGAWRFAPSFENAPARIDLVDDAAALTPGAIVVRLLEASARDATARDVFLVPAGDRSDAFDVTLGSEALRGEGETATTGCYRSLAIEGANRVRLSGAQGWSGSHTASGWNVVPSTTCAADTTLCLDAASGFGACG